MWMFPKIVVPQNEGFIMENPIKMDNLGVFPYFWKHPCIKHRTLSPQLSWPRTLPRGFHGPQQIRQNLRRNQKTMYYVFIRSVYSTAEYEQYPIEVTSNQ